MDFFLRAFAPTHFRFQPLEMLCGLPFVVEGAHLRDPKRIGHEHAHQS
jgi:hypothetical protein